MLVVDETALRTLQAAIVAAAHGLTNVNGTRHLLSTIDGRSLKQAALIAIQIASGDIVLTDEVIELSMPQQQQVGPFRIGRG